MSDESSLTPLLCLPTFQAARRACGLFEREYIGQNKKELWEWAVKTSLKEREKIERDLQKT